MTDSTQRPRPIGVFHAVQTKDHQARLRDGEPYYAINAEGRDSSLALSR